MNSRYFCVGSWAILLCLALNTLNAQDVTSQGNFMMGGTLGFSTADSNVKIEADGASVDNEGTRSTQFNISPRIGYFVTNNFALGIGMDYTLNRLREPVDLSDPQTDYETEYDSDLLFGPFGRVYFPIAEDKAFFLQGNFGFGSSQDRIRVGDDPQTTSTDVLAASFGPGFTIFSSDGIGIEAIVKYNWARSNASFEYQGTRNETTTYTNQLDFSIGFQVYFTRLQRVNDAAPTPEPDNEADPDSRFY
ncbi:MAG: outer membrane beta-barrel protein [bacterium]|nr:outer membrane beta-barrel protein [bacterium]